MLEIFQDNGKKLLRMLEAREWPQPEYIHMQYPLLLCHGFGSLANIVKPSPMNDICMLARSRGIPAFAPNITPYHSIEVRAQDWKRVINLILEMTGAPKLNIIAHSMGGLDIRFAISQMGMGGAVSSLTTISTPHYGTSLAEWGLSAPTRVRDLLIELFNWVGNNIYPKMKSDVWAAIQELTREYVTEVFNPRTPDIESVDYYSCSAACGKETDQPIGRLLMPMNNYIFEKEGINDGFVSEQSAHWGAYLGQTSLSHTDQLKINMSSDREQSWNDFWIGIFTQLSRAGH